MLTRLVIQDVVIIKKLELDFTHGLAALTGETGAGKSILLDSLGLAMGERADAGLVRAGQKQASVTAVFRPQNLTQALDELGIELEDDGELRLRRVVKADGKSRAYVNDTPVAAKVLKELGGHLAEVQGQFEQHSLLSPANHRKILDEFGGLLAQRDKVAASYAVWHDAQAKLDACLQAIEKDRQEEDYLRHVTQELADVAPQPGEHDALADRRQVLLNMEKLAEHLSEALGLMQADTGPEVSVSRCIRALSRVPAALETAVAPALEAMERAADDLALASQTLEQLVSAQEDDPQELESVAERLFLLKDLARKHGCDPDDLPGVLDELQAKLDLLSAADRTIEGLTDKLDKAKADYETQADSLSKGRAKAAAKLDKAIMAELKPLKLERAKVRSQLTSLPESAWGPKGKESVQFEVAMNTGDSFGAIGKVASGGELSRFLLALKVVLAEVNPVPTLIFDEVDSGLGGATADAVGERLDRLAQHVQLLCITHSPQVASRAQRHYHVEKKDKNKATETSVRILADQERVEEIARMISGATITPEARAAAAALLGLESDTPSLL